jgi:hypothetical protein
MGRGYKAMLNIVFTAVGKRDCAKYMIESVRRTMPEAHLIQLSDWNTEILDGVNEIRRSDYDKNMAVFILRARLGIKEPAIYLDDDVIVTKSIAHLLKGDFDILVCNREDSDGTTRLTRKFSPYNVGVLVCKNQKFWISCYTMIETLSNKLKKFGGEQVAIAQIVDSGKYRVKKVEGKMYNRVPKRNFISSPATYVWHYKGDRKRWMNDTVA